MSASRGIPALVLESARLTAYNRFQELIGRCSEQSTCQEQIFDNAQRKLVGWRPTDCPVACSGLKYFGGPTTSLRPRGDVHRALLRTHINDFDEVFFPLSVGTRNIFGRLAWGRPAR